MFAASNKDPREKREVNLFRGVPEDLPLIDRFEGARERLASQGSHSLIAMAEMFTTCRLIDDELGYTNAIGHIMSGRTKKSTAANRSAQLWLKSEGMDKYGVKLTDDSHDVTDQEVRPSLDWSTYRDMPPTLTPPQQDVQFHDYPVLFLVRCPQDKADGITGVFDMMGCSHQQL